MVERLAPKPVEVPVSETPKPVIVTQPDKSTQIAVKPAETPVKNEVPAMIEVPKTVTTASGSPVSSPAEPVNQPTMQDAIPSTPEAVLAAAEGTSATNPNATPDPLSIKTSSAES
ncbi:MAG: hypothetical protein WA194_08330 [Patescibacteria group bacterium]